MDSISEKQATSREAKALVALAFRTGPIENIHASKCRSIADGQVGQRITALEMKEIMKYAVDQLYRHLRMKIEDPMMYEAAITQRTEYTEAWDEPIGAPAAKTVRQQDTGILSNAGVLVYTPLPSCDEPRGARRPHADERRRNRLDWILSQAGAAIKASGLAMREMCAADSDGIKLLLAGDDTNAIQAELSSFLEFMKLPEGSRMVVFAGGASPPEEILLA